MNIAERGGDIRRMIRKPELVDMLGVSYPTIWTWMRHGKFPRPVKVVSNSIVAWYLDEIIDWQRSLERRDYKPKELSDCD